MAALLPARPAQPERHELLLAHYALSSLNSPRAFVAAGSHIDRNACCPRRNSAAKMESRLPGFRILCVVTHIICSGTWLAVSPVQAEMVRFSPWVCGALFALSCSDSAWDPRGGALKSAVVRLMR